MEDKTEKLDNGTAETLITHGGKDTSSIEMLFEATGGLSLSQVCAVTGLESSTIQNWVKRGWVSHPKSKKYEETHVSRILIINALKECIKLEHIAQLLTYVNRMGDGSDSSSIREYDLYNYLNDALRQLGHADDLSRGGVESVVEHVIKDYVGPTPLARYKIRKALTVMIYACVCTDVKRRTEAMMQQVLHELENPGSITEEMLARESIASVISGGEDLEAKKEKTAGIRETRKTVAQALREWDLESVESILSEDSESSEPQFSVDPPPDDEATKASGEQVSADNSEKSAQKPWYFRRN